MKVTSIVGRLFGSAAESSTNDAAGGAPDEAPSHVCESCGEEYYADPATSIRECRNCGGVKVSAA